ncbi:MAG TPA: right-handed parallel beta-helix repeat-containing protein, partial [Candidatus Krumholzibacterium sp.]|nr:right-handed parallel beta-helix repeat-containing protein [Candidatus Krumholzibacterium sp.]
LELETAVPYPVVVTGGRWLSSDSVPRVQSFVSDELPLSLPPRDDRVQRSATRITFEPPPFSPASLEVTSNIRGDARVYRTAAFWYAPPADQHPLSDASVDDIDGSHSFLVVDTVSHTIRGQAGTFEVHEDILVPRGYRLVLEPGTTLRFADNVGLITRGALLFPGTAEAPIRLEALASGSEGWSGIAVLQASEKSIWRHVTVSGTHGFEARGWGLTGAVTFFESDIEATASTFVGNRSEDALNVVSSNFDFEDLTVVDAAFDGLDVDFGRGRLSRGVFERIGWVGGGDAVDFSGSRATLDGTSFHDIGDKGISVGESSHIVVRAVTVSNAMAGVVVKDGSFLEVEGGKFQGIQLAGLMAYTK